MNTKNITNYKLKNFAELLDMSVKTFQSWCIKNKLHSY